MNVWQVNNTICMPSILCHVYYSIYILYIVYFFNITFIIIILILLLIFSFLMQYIHKHKRSTICHFYSFIVVVTENVLTNVIIMCRRAARKTNMAATCMLEGGDPKPTFYIVWTLNFWKNKLSSFAVSFFFYRKRKLFLCQCSVEI